MEKIFTAISNLAVNLTFLPALPLFDPFCLRSRAFELVSVFLQRLKVSGIGNFLTIICDQETASSKPTEVGRC